MATTRGRADSSLSERLLVEPEQFSFFQAVRLLQRFSPERVEIGRDGPPDREAVRFAAEPSLAFPASEILDIEQRDDGQRRMTVRFMGLTGPQGALPQHYTTLVIERLRKQDRALAEFLDLINHRVVSLFYRAWEKYRLHLGVTHGVQDRLSNLLFSLFGMGTRGLRDRLAVPDRALLFYTGLLGQRPRSAAGLAAVLGHYFDDVPVRVEQFVGQWLTLDPASQTSLVPVGGNTRLGSETVLGSRVWDTQSKFAVRLGPMSYERLCELLPSGSASPALLEMTRFYVGLELDFEFRLVLRARDVRTCELGSTGPHATRLGWSSWLVSSPRTEDADDVRFTSEALAAYHRQQGAVPAPELATMEDAAA